MKNIKKFVFIILFISSFFLLNAETFRVSKMHTLEIQQDTASEASAKVGINEGFAVFIPADREFIDGLEIKMDIPESVAEWVDTVACSVYDKVKPRPSAAQIDYSATRQYVSTLPGRLSWVLQIPLQKSNSLKANKYTTKMDTIPDVSDNFIFVRLQPVMKGIPEETLRAKIGVTVKPILKNKGKLQINLSSQKNLMPCTVYVDDEPVSFQGNKPQVLLDSGIHNVTIISESYRNEVRTVRISQAKTTELAVEMKSIEPTLLVLAPEGTAVLLDNEKCTTIGTEFPISEGEHKIKFTIGDYEIIRTINVIKGKTYTANFEVDLQISEE